MAGSVCVGQLVCNRTPLLPVRGSERISAAFLSLYESQTTILCSLLLAGNLQFPFRGDFYSCYCYPEFPEIVILK